MQPPQRLTGAAAQSQVAAPACGQAVQLPGFGDGAACCALRQAASG